MALTNTGYGAGPPTEMPQPRSAAKRNERPLVPVRYTGMVFCTGRGNTVTLSTVYRAPWCENDSSVSAFMMMSCASS